MTKFEKKLEELRSDIIRQSSVNKKNGGTGSNLNKSFISQKSILSGGNEANDSKHHIKRLQRDLENDNFPSLNALRAMGVTNFRPSCNYQTYFSSKMLRMLKDEGLIDDDDNNISNYKRLGSETLKNKNKLEMDTIGEDSSANNDSSRSLTPMNTEINRMSRNTNEGRLIS